MTERGVSDAIEAYESELQQEENTTFAMADLASVIEQLHHDREFLIEFFIPDQLKWPVPPIHCEIMDWLLDTTAVYLVIAVPRDHAKTTLAKVAVCWYLLFTPYRFPVYVSNTFSIARNACKDILKYLQSPNFVSVFGHIELEKESETEGLWIFILPLPNKRTKRCILKAQGAGQQIRGLNIDDVRPDISVVDDLEDKENIATPLLLEKLIDWFMGTFRKALAENHKLVYIGNMHSKNCLLERLTKSSRWKSIVYGCLVKTKEGIKPLWADRWPQELLIEDFKEYEELGRANIWMAEMMNKPVTSVNGFRFEQLHFAAPVAVDDCLATFIAVDPAFGKNEQNDNSAITVHAVFHDRCPQVVEHVEEKMSEAEMYEHVKRLAYKWNAWTVGIESVAAQKVLVTLFSLYAANDLITSFEFVPVSAGRASKLGRISAFVSAQEHKSYAITRGDIIMVDQILNIDRTKLDNDDDLVDSASYGPIMIERYLPIITAGVHGENLAAQSTAQRQSEIANV